MLCAVRRAGARSARQFIISAPAALPCSPATISTSARAWSRDSLAGREPNMWRYRELLPLFDGETPVTLGEGFTPLFHARALGATLGLDRLYIKDESLNPTNSFKARGQSAAITRAKCLGAKTLRAAHGGQRRQRGGRLLPPPPGSRAKVFMPKDAKRPFVRRMPSCTAPTSRWSTA